MNRLTIIGNLCSEPELRTTPNGINVCTFTVAVNRRRGKEGEQTADFFRVAAWRQLGENCAKYLTKGKKVAVIGEVSARAYEAKDGTWKAALEVTADEVEFLSPASTGGEMKDAPSYQAPQAKPQGEAMPEGWQEITDGDLPF